MAKPQIYSMKWSNYQAHMGGIFVQLLESETMVDVTLCAEEEKISCHRIILSAASSYFQEILSGVDSSHAVVILCGISPEDLKSIINFVYRGELSVSSERFSSILKAAETLKIYGLTQISSQLPVLQVPLLGEGEEGPTSPLEVKQEQVEEMEGEEDQLTSLADQDAGDTSFTVTTDENEDHQSEFSLEIATTIDETNENRRKRKQFSKKDYSEDALAAALNDLVAGRSLLDAASTHQVPRSTLYSRARIYGIAPLVTRHEYPEENLSAAVQMVKDGASLQTASENYGIPKTVLWRRVQKDIGSYALSHRARLRQRYLPTAKEAAIRALQNGEKMNKVATQYKIPKTTLFREKTRLVEEGKLPLSCLNKRVPNNDCFKQMRLSQAVEACKAGRMSQAAASTTFNVSKTTIWRRLQQRDGGRSRIHHRNNVENEQRVLSFQEVTEIPVAYSEDGSYIILAPPGELNYQGGDIVVDSVLLPESVENVGEVIEIQETPYCIEDTEVNVTEVMDTDTIETEETQNQEISVEIQDTV